MAVICKESLNSDGQ